MTHAAMYQRVLENDTSCNGRFFTGVLTTGIYCLPACRARKPKAENVRFFPTCEAARAAGLRPCKKCHPDDFARGADPVLASIEALVATIRRQPGEFPDVRSVVRRSGFGTTRLFELVREHYHVTPAEILLHARLEAAKSLLATTGRGLLEIAQEVGFESQSAFHDHFRRCNGLTPGAYRSLDDSRPFSITLPDGYPLAYLRRALSRDVHSNSEQLSGDCYQVALRMTAGPALLRLSLGPSQVGVEFTGGSAREAHRLVIGILGLEQSAAAFARLAGRLGFERLVAGRRELRLVQVPSVYEGLLWAIIGQQINFPFACLLKRRLYERVGVPLAEGLVALPTPAAIAALTPSELLPLQYSRQKAAYLIETSRLITEGKLDLESLPALSATRVQRTLLGIRGLGPWSVNYIMMRALGFPDCVPLGDTGVTSGLQTLMNLEERPDMDATRRLMAVFSPHRSLATAHLWQLHQPPPS